MVSGGKELRDWIAFAVALSLGAFVVYGDFKHGVKLFVKSLFWAVCLAIAYRLAARLVERTRSRAATPADGRADGAKESEYGAQRKTRADQLQELADEQGKVYTETVLEPRRRRELEEAEKKLHRFTPGRPFAGPGLPLDDGWVGVEDAHVDGPGVDEPPSELLAPTRRAAAARRLPGTSSSDQQAETAGASLPVEDRSSRASAVKKAKPVAKARVVMPPEPIADDPSAVALAFRTPLGHLHRRRFLKSDRLTVLYDFVSTLGYDESAYVLATSFPRRLLEPVADTDLSAEGLEKAVLLNVEARDP